VQLGSLLTLNGEASISDATAAFLLLRNLLESRVKLDSGMGTPKKPSAQGKRPVQVRAKIVTDDGGHDENDKRKRKCDQN